jgi:isopenicillin N synthase-like dioxygenase
MIPLVKLGEALRPGSVHGREVAQALGAACETSGFFYVAEHGVPDDLLIAQFALARELFALPAAARDGVVSAVTDAAPPGSSLHRAAAGDDATRTFYECVSGAPQNVLPGLPDAHAQTQAYLCAMQRLSSRLMQLIALSLELPEDAFDEGSGQAAMVLRMLRYASRDAGVRAHTDRHALTVLAQDHHAGLEVRLDGEEWIAVPPREGALLVHPGDALAHWTRGRYRSRAHRVRRAEDAGEPRLSIPFFYSPPALR